MAKNNNISYFKIKWVVALGYALCGLISGVFTYAAIDLYFFDASILRNSPTLQSLLLPDLNAAPKAALDYYMGLVSSMYLVCELYVCVLLLLILSTVALLKRTKNDLHVQPPAPARIGIFYTGVIVYSFGILAQVAGMTALFCTDCSFIYAAYQSFTMSVVSLVVAFLLLVSSMYLLWCGQKYCRALPNIHIYVCAGLIITDVLLFLLLTGPLPVGSVMVLVTNVIVTAATVWLHPTIHSRFGQYVQSYRSPNRETLAKRFYLGLFQFIVVSKWNAWWLNNFSQMAAHIHTNIELSPGWKTALFTVGLLLWVITARNLMISAYAAAAATRKPDIPAPTEPVLVYYMVLRPWLLTLKVTYLRYHSILSNGLSKQNYGRRISVSLQCVLKALVDPTFGLEKAWLSTLVAKHVLWEGELDIITWALFSKWGIVCHMTSSMFNITALAGGSSVLVGLAAFGENVTVIPNQCLTALHFLESVPGMADARASNATLNAHFNVLMDSTYRLNVKPWFRLNNVQPNFFFPLPDVASANNAVLNIVKEAKLMGVEIPQPEPTLANNVTRHALNATRGMLPAGAIFDVANSSSSK